MMDKHEILTLRGYKRVATEGKEILLLWSSEEAGHTIFKFGGKIGLFDVLKILNL